MNVNPAFWPLMDEITALRRGQMFSRTICKAKPSREFLIRQATLNALAQHVPEATRLDGAPSAMRQLVAICGWKHGQPSAWFCRSVRDHFSIIEAQYAD